MKLTFIGADHEVTGSCHAIEACGKYILIDCGLKQGSDDDGEQTLPENVSDIDYVLLTHAHIDHSGLLPLLYARGFRGRILTTKATCELCQIMLRDSAHIQETEAEWKNRKARRAGRSEVEPLYSMNDAEGVLGLFIECSYNSKINLEEGIDVRFVDAGHLLGSASIEIWITEGETTRKIVFSGDIGNLDRPIIKDPEYISDADYVVMESTYGDRNHNTEIDYVARLAQITQQTFERGGNIVIPSFAVGRTQEMLYYYRIIKEKGLVKGFDGFEVYVDSPLAVEATEIFSEGKMDYFDEEAVELVKKGINPIRFPGLKLSLTSDDSKAINFNNKPKVIISASGMCEAGRIRHHLKHNLWRKDSTIIFVGYQAAGTIGRILLDGALEVKLFGELINVEAQIIRLEGVSGHADKAGLIKWATSFKNGVQKLFVVHGENEVCESFAACLRDEYDIDAMAPYRGTVYDLATGSCIVEGAKIEPVKRLEKAPSGKKTSDVFERLLAAGRRLLTVIRHNEGGANKDLAKMADQINSLCDKWDR